jgi:hypothetical protein
MSAASDEDSASAASAWSAGSDPLYCSWGQGLGKNGPPRDELERTFFHSNSHAELTLLIAVENLRQEKQNDFLLQKSTAELSNSFVLPLEDVEQGLKWAVLSLKIWLIHKETLQTALRREKAELPLLQAAQRKQDALELQACQREQEALLELLQS